MKMKSKLLVNTLTFITVSTLVVSACKKKEAKSELATPVPSPISAGLTDNYTVSLSALYPEGIDYDTKNNRFVISSFNKGAVYTLSSDGKAFSQLINDNNLIAATGVFTDEANDRIIVVSGDAGASEKSAAAAANAGKRGYLAFYNALTGVLMKSIDLKLLVPNGAVFPNDIAVDKDGNVYITDSFSPILYKIDTNYNASVFMNDPQFSVPAGSFGLNGIVYDSNGFLLVAHTQSNKLFKVNIASKQITEVSATSANLKTPDGLEWINGKLAVVENGLSDGKIHILKSTDNWASAVQSEEFVVGKNEFPTTAVTTPNGKLYVLHSWLGKLLSGDKTQATYDIKSLNVQ